MSEEIEELIKKKSKECNNWLTTKTVENIETYQSKHRKFNLNNKMETTL